MSEVLFRTEPHRIILSPEVDAEIDALAADLDGNRGDAILKAIALLRLAVDAWKEGKRVGIAGPDQPLETEITEH
jgi:hypothetical protein